MDGQMSIFDYPEYLPEEHFDTMSAKTAADIIGARLETKFSLNEKYYHDHYSARKDGCMIYIGFEYNFDGKRYLDVSVDYKTGCYGTPATSIDDAVQCIDACIKRFLGICKHSNHKCNKEELFRIALEDNPFCPKVCCRLCTTQACGARCNGSSEPAPEDTEFEQSIVDAIIEQFPDIKDVIRKYDYKANKLQMYIKPFQKTIFSKSREFLFEHNNEEHRLVYWASSDDVLGIYKGKVCVANTLCKYIVDECLERSCENDDRQQCNDVTYDREGRPYEVPAWMDQKRCENCQSWAMYQAEMQPPPGHGIIGWCAEHKEKVNKGSYCQKFEKVITR